MPTDDAQVGETVAGIRRAAARAREQPTKKRAATLDVLARLVDPIEADLAGAERCPVRALYRWLEAAGITEGPAFRRVRRAPLPGSTATGRRLGDGSIDPGTVARIVQARAAAAGFARGEFGGHSLKRGALNEGRTRQADLPALQKLGRHKSLAALGEYLDQDGRPEASPLRGVL